MPVEWILLFVGAITLVVGSALALVGLSAMVVKPRPSNQSFLAPVLAVDTLEHDLRIAYSKTIVLDARASAEARTIEEAGLGAEIRRLILELQAARGRGDAIDLDLTNLLEPCGDWRDTKRRVKELRRRQQEQGKAG